ncbi:MAG: zinc ABC transporter substrate-binding protein [Eubacteriales bacterium]
MKRRNVIVIGTILLFSVVLLGFSACGEKTEAVGQDKMTVAVSIVPEATFVEKVAGDKVNIVTIIPSGNSPANYQPTTTEMQALSDASVYFVMQMPAEEANILPKVTDFNADIKLVNLRDAVSAVYPLHEMGAHSHDHEDGAEEADEDHDEDHEEALSVDPHIWLSPKRAIVMVETIRDTLSEMDPDNAEVYKKNAAAYIEELSALDADIAEIVSGMETKAFMIYHGAYGYFADDYGLEMISLEVDGKAASATVMAEAIEHAKEENISHIFYQDEFDDNQAKTVADEIGGSVTEARALAPDYIAALTEFAEALAAGE